MSSAENTEKPSEEVKVRAYNTFVFQTVAVGLLDQHGCLVAQQPETVMTRSGRRLDKKPISAPAFEREMRVKNLW